MIKAPVVVQLYFEGTLSADRAQPVTVQLGEEPVRTYWIEAMETNDGMRPYEEMVLRLRRVPGEVVTTS